MEGAGETSHLSPALLSGSQRLNSIYTSCIKKPRSFAQLIEWSLLVGQKGGVVLLSFFKPSFPFKISFKHLHLANEEKILPCCAHSWLEPKNWSKKEKM